MFRSLLVLCVLFPLQLVTAEWYAVFWNSTVKSQLNNTFLTRVPLTSNDQSSSLFQCDHTTIAFQPTDTTPYISRLGEKQTARILAYAHDEHGQAILLRYDSAKPVPTLNSFPHTTISVSNQGPYSAVYSNDLWARVNASGAVNITSSGGYPATISFLDMTNVVANTLNLTLPAMTIGANAYEATVAQVVIPPTGTWFELEGTFCLASGWNGSVCNPWPRYKAGDCEASCGLTCQGIQYCFIDYKAQTCACYAESGAVTGIIIAVLIALIVLLFVCCFFLRCGVFAPATNAPKKI